MRKGLFSSNVSICRIIIKKYISNDITSLFRNIKIFKNIKKYEKDIEKLGFNTAKIYFSFQIKNSLFIIQKLIKGETVEEVLKSKKYDISLKKEIVKKILNKMFDVKGQQVIIDWNLKNFILYKGKIFYVDFTPVLYRKSVMLINSKSLKPYTEMLLNEKIQFCSFLGYVCNYLIDLPRETLKVIYDELVLIAKENGIVIKDIDENSHLMERKVALISNYLDSNMTKENLKIELLNYSMKHLVYDLGGDNDV